MSYILDALKKSEQERGNGNIPSVQTVHSASLNYTHKKTYWQYFLIAAVLLNLIAILYFVFNKEETQIIEASTTQKTVSTAAAIDTATYLETRETTAVTNAPAIDTQPIQPEPTTNSSSNQYQAPKTAHTDNQTSTGNILEFYDLPDSIKQQLPAIIISAHVYSSNPLQRSIVINNNFLEEGEYVLDDLILDEITSDGAVFFYRGTKFHHGVVNSWR